MRKINTYSRLGLIAALGVFSACKNDDPAKKLPAKQASSSSSTSAVEGSSLKLINSPQPLFLQTTAKLDLGGQQLSFSKGNPFSALAELYKKLHEIDVVKNGVAQGNKISPQFSQGLLLLEELAKDSGLASNFSYGSSSIKKGDFYHNKSFAPSEKAYENKLIYAMMGGAERELGLPKILPEHTLIAGSMTINAQALPALLTKYGKKYPELLAPVNTYVQMLPVMAEGMKIDYSALMAELDTEVGFVLTMDTAHPIELPSLKELRAEVGNPGMPFPEAYQLFLQEDKKTLLPKPRLHLVMRKPGAQIKKLISFAASQVQMKLQQAGDVQMLKSPIATPYLDSTAALVLNDDWLILSSEVEEASLLATGKAPAGESIKKLCADFSSKGNSFALLSGKTTDKLILQLFDKAENAAKEYFSKQLDISSAEQTEFQKILKQMRSHASGQLAFAGQMSFTPEGPYAFSRSSFLPPQSGTTDALAMLAVATVVAAPAAAMFYAMEKPEEEHEKVLAEKSDNFYEFTMPEMIVNVAGTKGTRLFIFGVTIHCSNEKMLQLFQKPNIKNEVKSLQVIFKSELEVIASLRNLDELTAVNARNKLSKDFRVVLNKTIKQYNPKMEGEVSAVFISKFQLQ